MVTVVETSSSKNPKLYYWKLLKHQPQKWMSCQAKNPNLFFFHWRVIFPQPFSVKKERAFFVKDPQIVDCHLGAIQLSFYGFFSRLSHKNFNRKLKVLVSPWRQWKICKLDQLDKFVNRKFQGTKCPLEWLRWLASINRQWEQNLKFLCHCYLF